MSTKKKKVMSLRREWIVWAMVGLLLAVGVWLTVKKSAKPTEKTVTTTQTQKSDHQYLRDPINLPEPAKSGRMSLEQAMFARRSRRDFTDKALSIKQLSQMLWAMQGVTADWGGRTTPSAKEVYPLEIYVVVNKVEGLETGVYHYIAGTSLKGPHHQLGWIKAGELSKEIADAVVQSPAKGVPVVIILSGNFEKMKAAFDNKPVDNNVYLEAGHAAQNLYLEVESLGLGMVTIGGFNGATVSQVVGMQLNEKPIYAIPVGYPK